MTRVVRCLALCGLATMAAGAAGQTSRPAETAGAEGGLLIVVPTALEAPLREYAAARGARLPVETVRLEDVLRDTPGVDDPEKLKRFLYRGWRERGVRYALLVGDADVMPVRYMVLDRVTAAAFDYAFYPSDLYYGDVAGRDGAFDDWNGQREGFHAGYFGEVRGEKNKSDAMNYDGIDYRPELAVGRWPVSSVEEARTVADKSLRADRRRRGRGDRPRAALLATGGWIENRPAMDELAGVLAAGWRIEKRYFADAGRTDGTPPPSEAELVGLLNEGVGLVLHSGHGQDDAWDRSISVRTLGALSNADRLPVMFSAGCSTARLAALPPYEGYVDAEGVLHRGTNAGEVFGSPPPPPAAYQRGACNGTGLGEQLLRGGPNGAAAYIGCNTGSQPCGMTLMRGFAEGLARPDGVRIGDAWVGAVAYYYERERLAELKPTADWYPASIFFQGMKFMLFGDPTLEVGSW